MDKGFDRSKRISDFVGEATLVEGRVESRGAGGTVVRLAGGAVELAASTVPAGGNRVTVVLRPEKLRLVDGRAAAANAFPAVVTDALYLGETTKYWLRMAGETTVLVKTQSRSDAVRSSKGETLWVAIDPRDVIVVAE